MFLCYCHKCVTFHEVKEVAGYPEFWECPVHHVEYTHVRRLKDGANGHL